MSKEIEVVIARYQENLSWISMIPNDFYLTIYNKGSPIDGDRLPRQAEIINIENVGRESETYARHIIKYYSDLANYVIFLQGDPFPHCENFKHIIKNIKEFIKEYGETYDTVPFTNGWMINRNIPYLSVFNQWKIQLPMNLANIFIDIQSTRTLDSLFYHDKGIHMIKEDYLKLHDLPHGTNLINHFLSYLGIGYIVPEKINTFPMFFAANFMVSKSQILRHNIDIYKRLWKLNCKNPIYGFFTERTWLTIFGGGHKLLELQPDDREPITYSPVPLVIDEEIELHEKEIADINIKNRPRNRYLPPFLNR